MGIQTQRIAVAEGVRLPPLLKDIAKENVEKAVELWGTE